ncbi:MAG: TauD/TfdA family dioxygenase, partial [Rhodospirillales bacterium]|nr:TauD/TfdA family dioxygenase [Rhodospirillales bacterium]
IQPQLPALGAEISGVDLSVDLDSATFAEIKQAFVDHSVIAFLDQTLTPAQHIAFSRRFGKLQVHVFKDHLLEEYPEIYSLSNIVEGGKPKGRANAGQYWHSDLTYEKCPSLGSVMFAHEVPEVGGDTMFSSMAFAYETLSETMKSMLDGLTAVHHFAHAFGSWNKTSPKVAQEVLDVRPPVEHPVIRIHPESGRKCLFVNPGFTVGIKGMNDEENEALLGFLYRHATRPEFVYRHKWRKGDVVIWDNRALMHCGISDYDESQPRLMHRTTIEDPVGVMQATH